MYPQRAAASVVAPSGLGYSSVPEAVDWSDVERPRARRRDEQGDIRRANEVSNCGPYVLIALALAFVGFELSIEITADVLVPVFILMFPALVLLALSVSSFRRRREIRPPEARQQARATLGHPGPRQQHNPH
jgi:hypothetical protein